MTQTAVTKEKHKAGFGIQPFRRPFALKKLGGAMALFRMRGESACAPQAGKRRGRDTDLCRRRQDRRDRKKSGIFIAGKEGMTVPRKKAEPQEAASIEENFAPAGGNYKKAGGRRRVLRGDLCGL